LTNLRRWLPVAPAALIYLSAFALPVLFFFVLSFWSARAMRIRRDFTFDNYIETWQKYADVIGATILIALATAVVTVTVVLFSSQVARFVGAELFVRLEQTMKALVEFTAVPSVAVWTVVDMVSVPVWTLLTEAASAGAAHSHAATVPTTTPINGRIRLITDIRIGQRPCQAF